MEGNEKSKSNSIFGFILKILLGLLVTFIVLIVGVYCFLRFTVGIDVVDVFKKVKLLKTPFSESAVVSEPLTNQNAFEGFELLFGANSVYTNNEGTYTFNEDEFTSISLVPGEITLTASQYGACVDAFLTGVTSNKVEVGEIDLTTSIKQLKFSNFTSNEGITKIDANIVLNFDVSALTNELKGQSGSPIGVIAKLLPNGFYLTINSQVSIDENNANKVEVTNRNVKINNLSQKDSSDILQFISKFLFGDVSLETEISNIFAQSVFAGKQNTGFLSSINGFNTYTFKMVEDEICVVIS